MLKKIPLKNHLNKQAFLPICYRAIWLMTEVFICSMLSMLVKHSNPKPKGLDPRSLDKTCLSVEALSDRI